LQVRSLNFLDEGDKIILANILPKMQINLSLLGILLSARGATAAWNVPATYAIKPSSDGRFLTDDNEIPFFWQADTAWQLFHRLNYSEAEEYLSDRAKNAFTVALAVGFTQEGISSPNRNGDLTFIDLDPTKPNEAYWSYVDSIIELAWSKGIRICMVPAWGSQIHDSGSSDSSCDSLHFI
jgi:hypothetical protein